MLRGGARFAVGSRNTSCGELEINPGFVKPGKAVKSDKAFPCRVPPPASLGQSHGPIPEEVYRNARENGYPPEPQFRTHP
jgi:hypothetical protein